MLGPGGGWGEGGGGGERFSPPGPGMVYTVLGDKREAVLSSSTLLLLLNVCKSMLPPASS